MPYSIQLLAASSLFCGIRPEQLAPLLTWMEPFERSFEKGEQALRAGEQATHIGFVLEGEMTGARPTPDGRRLVAGQFGAGSFFGDILAAGRRESPVTVTATSPARVLFLPSDAIFRPGCPVPQAHARFTQNLLAILGEKYFQLDRRLELLLIKSLRGRIAAYLLHESRAAGSATFRIRHNRAALAAYLGCERSALCRELSRMQADGLIETYRSSFRLLDTARLRAGARG